MNLTLLKWYGGDVKGYVGLWNNTLKTNDVKDLIIKGFKTITPEKWTNFCNHVENKIEPQYWKSDHTIEEIPKIIINLDSDSDTDSVRVKLLICTGQNKQRFQVILFSIINLY